ncbi:MULTISPECIES: hypothetical protein [Brachybacterium]|uniref:hypothetical protein n=1 Tax=Brachybacterium TaxID=43668 RepID=UPI0008A3F391|nr:MULTISPECIES: hypothetical protein [Brachybacterium]OFT65635.1 hypothetical protein HMPREF3159_00865 [Brachybacterium sp. HMSC06H03]
MDSTRSVPSRRTRLRAGRLLLPIGALVLTLLAAVSVLVPWPVLGSGFELAETTADEATFLLDCDSSAAREPSSLVLTCADAGAGLDALRWTSWGEEEAGAHGIIRLNVCEPSCAEGSTQEYRVRVVASDRLTSGIVSTYRTLTVTYLDDAPSWAPSGTEHYDVTRTQGRP